MKQAGSRKPSSAVASDTDIKTTTHVMRVAVPADKSSVTLEMMPESGASGHITLTEAGLAGLIRTLGQVHAAMVEGRQIPPLDRQAIQAVFNPRWTLGPGLMSEASTFVFHHPGYGDLGFLVPIAEVETMITALSSHVEAAKATKRSTRN